MWLDARVRTSILGRSCSFPEKLYWKFKMELSQNFYSMRPHKSYLERTLMTSALDRILVK